MAHARVHAHKPNNHKAIDLIKSDLVQEKMTGIQGLRELVVVALSPTSIVGIASYESVADLEKAQETVPEILGV